jgi:hypothetical protein
MREKLLLPNSEKPHVFILGAGASRACLPNGDFRGRKLPLMKDLIEILTLKDILKDYTHDTNNSNFEVIYSKLSTNPKSKDIVSEIEKKVYKYFSEMLLPPEPTIYDYLILSLRSKDVIATFNWDPLLYQAAERVREYITTDIPELCYLHGNTALKIDYNNKRIKPSRIIDPNSHPCPLLFPVTKKNYKNNTFIKAQWDFVEKILPETYVLTIFGYGAPDSDVEAVQLIQNAFNRSKTKEFNEVEIIDKIEIKKDDIHEKWKDLISNFHMTKPNDFYDSIACYYPRRSCEFVYQQTMLNEWGDDSMRLQKGLTFKELAKHIKPFLNC